MIRSCRNIWEKFSVTSEVIAILMIIALVLFLQFWGVMAVYQYDTFRVEKELYDCVRWQVEDWNNKGSMACGGGMRGYYFQEGGREVVVIRGDSSYVFKLDSRDRVEDVYLRLACDLNVMQPITLQILDSVVGENLNGRLGGLFVIFQRVDSTGKVLEVFPRVE